MSIGDNLEINLGHNPDSHFVLKALSMRHVNIGLKIRRAKELKCVSDDATVLYNHAKVLGWNENRIYACVIKNSVAVLSM